MSISKIGLFCGGCAIAFFIINFYLYSDKGKTYKNIIAIVALITSIPVIATPMRIYGPSIVDDPKDIWFYPIGWFVSVFFLYPAYRFMWGFIKNKFDLDFMVLSSRKK